MIHQEIEQLLQPTVEALGYELWACEYLPQGKHSLLRVYIDSPNGIGVDDCEKVSRQVSALLDVEEPINGHYTLEVSSPGLERPLFKKEHFQQYTGNLVFMKLRSPVNQRRKLTGMLEKMDGNNVIITIEDEELIVPFNDITKANLLVEG